jgi:hypothetical protein
MKASFASILLIAVAVLFVAAIAVPFAAAGTQTFAGTITDSMCARADHSSMRMGPTDAECTVACVSAHGATYVLYDGSEAYALSDQRRAEEFAAQKVTVTGVLVVNTKSIQVETIALAK